MDFKFKESTDKVKDYFREVYMEGKRVTWPSRKDALKGTYVVLITTTVAAIFLGIVDIGLAKLVQTLLRG
jgi:preprotein translocase subunit SecE